jgi:MFS family permease
VNLFVRRRAAASALPSSISIRSPRLRLPTAGLWANRAFMNLWSAESIAQFGSQLSPVAIPLLAVLTLDASPFEMGLLTAANGIPVLLFGFFAGVWVDRLPRKPLMMAADIGRALTMLAIPVAALLDILSMGLLLAVSLLIGAQSVVFNAAYSSILPAIVERRELSDANGKLYASMSVSQVAGPAAAGSLVSLITAPAVMVINAVTYLGSAFFIRRIDVDESVGRHEARDQHIWREIREGFTSLFGSAILRAQALSSGTINFGGWIFLAVYVLYMTDSLGLSATGVGLVYAAGGVGALVGSLLTSRLAARFGVGPTMVWSAIAFGVFCLGDVAAILVPAYALPLVIVAETGAWLALVIFNVLGLSLRQSITPNRLLGRVAASNTVLVQGLSALGSLTGGVLGSLIGVQVTLIIGCAGMLLAAGWVIASPIRTLRAMPELVEEVIS